MRVSSAYSGERLPLCGGKNGRQENSAEIEAAAEACARIARNIMLACHLIMKSQARVSIINVGGIYAAEMSVCMSVVGLCNNK